MEPLTEFRRKQLAVRYKELNDNLNVRIRLDAEIKDLYKQVEALTERKTKLTQEFDKMVITVCPTEVVDLTKKPAGPKEDSLETIITKAAIKDPKLLELLRKSLPNSGI